MKLVYKSIIINTLVSILILCLGEYSLYYFLKNKIEKETAEHLTFESFIVKNELNNGVSLDAFKHNIGDVLEIVPIQKIKYQTPIIKDVQVREETEEDDEEDAKGHQRFKREETFTSKQVLLDVTQNEKNYRISIIKTIDEDEGLAGKMSTIIFISGFFMLTILVSINVLIYHKLFFPMYKLIKDIKDFSIQKQKKILPPKTSTTEFISLGEEVSRMSEKIISDYASIKEFMENMTHEIQTPLAVINTKIERCFQDKNLTEEQALLLSSAAKAANKLFNINKGLTLISKLDNQQYVSISEVNLNDLIQQRIQYFDDFIANKNIIISEKYSQHISLHVDSSLAEILIDNLIKNAIQHNSQNGNIYITIENNTLIIANNGEVPTVPTTSYFDRFYSQKPLNSLGLGLSIIKKIVEYYGYTISYNYQNELHTVVVDFNPKTKTT